MAMQQKTLSNRTVAALTVERDTVFWDRDLTGFGIRVYPTGIERHCGSSCSHLPNLLISLK